MTTLTLATLNLEEGRQIDMLPDLAGQAGDIDLFFFQFSDRRVSSRSSKLLFCVADMSVTLPAPPGVPAAGCAGWLRSAGKRRGVLRALAGA